MEFSIRHKGWSGDHFIFLVHTNLIDILFFNFGAKTFGGFDRASIRPQSLITLTTQGYGDIAPVHPVARMLAATEGAVGTLYIAVVISALVGLLKAEKPR